MASQFKSLLFEMTGDKRMLAKLESMAHGVGSTIARRAVLAGIRVIAKAQKDAAPSARFKRAIGYRVGKNKNTLVQEAKAGLNVAKPVHGRMRNGKQLPSVSMPQGHLLILGTANRWTGTKQKRSKSGTTYVSTGKARAFRGRIKPMASQFIKRATASSMGAATDAAGKSAWDAIAREAAKG